MCGQSKGTKTHRCGSIFVETKDGAQANRLLAAPTIPGMEITAQIADRLNSVEGSIREDSLAELSNTEILTELGGQGVCRVEGLRSSNISELGPNPTVRLSFRGPSYPKQCTAVPTSEWRCAAAASVATAVSIGSHSTRV